MIAPTNNSLRILSYSLLPVEFYPYDPAVTDVARLLREAIQNEEPRLRVEHIGSSAVPGCGGKGVVDLAVLYPEGALVRARAVLDALGFQKQGGAEPFPEERPMRVGSVRYNGRNYRIHAHVIAMNSDEIYQLIWFRDSLIQNPALREKYENRKREILAAGIRDQLKYCKAKEPFIASALKGR